MNIQVINNNVAKKYLDKHHRLGYGVGVRFCFGVIIDKKICGVIAFGNPITNNCLHKYAIHQSKIFELKKMHCLDILPRNSESKFISYCIKKIRENYKFIEAVITYCEAHELASAYKGANFKKIDENRYILKYITKDKVIDKNSWFKLNYNLKYKDFEVEYGHTCKYAIAFNSVLQLKFIEIHKKYLTLQ